jgi:hypothetical protein
MYLIAASQPNGHQLVLATPANASAALAIWQDAKATHPDLQVTDAEGLILTQDELARRAATEDTEDSAPSLT